MKISSYEIDFGDGRKVSQKDAIHTYQQDGSYTLKLKVTDNKGLSTQKNVPLVVKSNLVFSDSSVVFAATELKKNKKYNVTAINSESLYKLSVVRNDNSFLIAVANLLGLNNAFDYNVLINGLQIFAEDEIKLDSQISEKIVKLSAGNQLEVEYKNEVLNIFDVKVTELAVVEDVSAPIIATDFESGGVTNNNLLPVRISDLSGEVTTYVWKVMLQAQTAPVTAGTVNQLIITTNQKNFSIPLNEGSNYFIIQAVDKFNNRSNFVYLNDIYLDSTSPLLVSISPALQETQYSYVIPYARNIYAVFSERVQSVTINGLQANISSGEGNVATASMSVATEGDIQLEIVASDFAGNTTVFTHSFRSVHVDTAVGLTLDLNSISLQTKESSVAVPFQVTAEAPTKTIVLVNEQQVLMTTAQSGALVIPLIQEGNNRVEVNVYYDVPHFDTTLKKSGAFNVTKDSLAPTLTYSNPVPQQIFYTNQLPLSVPVSLQFNEFVASITFNGLTWTNFSGQFISQYVVSQNGVSSINFTATDRMGNGQNFNLPINVNFSNTAPNIKFDDSIIDLLTNKISVPISGTSDKYLSNITLNGVPLTVSSDGLSFTGFFDAPSNGRHRLELVGTDRWGNVGNAVTYIRVQQQLPDNLLNPPAPTLVYDDESRTYLPEFGNNFKEPQLTDACAALDQVFDSEIEFKENLDVLEENLQDNPYQTVSLGRKSIKVPRKEDLENFYDDIQEKLDYLKAPYLMMCKGINILPESDCTENRRLFRIVMSEYPEPLIINSLPIPESVKRFAIPRTNICTGFDSSNLTCNDMVEFLPIVAEFVVPSLGQLLGSPVGQFVTETILCGELCDTPIAKTTPVCNQYAIPEIPQISPLPAPISLPPRFGGPVPGSDWGGGSGGGWPNIGGGGSCGGWFNSCPDDGNGSGGGSGDGKFMCSIYPSLWFCGGSDGYDKEYVDIDIVPINCSELTDINAIINFANSRGVPLTEQFTAVVAKCLQTSVPGYPNVNRPVLTVLTPVQNQVAEATVRVTGYVSDLYAQVKINGQIVPTLFSVQGAYFDVTINTPADKKVLVEAANLFSLQADPIEIILGTGSQLTLNNDLLASTSSHSCVVINGAAKCWGANALGQLSTGDNISSSGKMVQVLGLESGVESITVGQDFSCAVVNKKVYCWGANSSGQLGRGLTGLQLSYSLYPQQVLAISEDVRLVKAGFRHVCAVTDSNNVKCWGQNIFGGLGTGDNLGRTIPTAVLGLNNNVLDVDAGDFYTCALIADGSVKCWGRNNVGQLGNATGVDSNLPVNVLVETDSANVAIEVTSSGTACVQNTNYIKCWGGTALVLGRGVESTNAYIPDYVTGLSTLIIEKSITSGRQHSCLLDEDVIKCWGIGSSGQLGDLAVVNYRTTPSPITINFPQGQFKALNAGSDRTCALVNDDVHCWGQGYGLFPIKVEK